MFKVHYHRFHEDHRRRGWFSIFPEDVLDINVVQIPNAGTITAWHRHQRQTDYWAVIQGSLQLGLFNDASDPYWIFLSPFTQNTIIIEPNIWHGYKCLEPNTILIYGLTRKYDGTDEERMTLEEAGVNWDLGAK